MAIDKRTELVLPEIILASGSPRRSEILNAVGWRFRKIVPDVDESEREGESPAAYVERLAIEKAKAVAVDEPETIVLGADTTVVVDERIVGKPVDLADAGAMIRSLSGRWHEVLTGVALALDGTCESEVQTTRVKFSELNEEDVQFLVNYGEPLDKAGAYAVQAQAALYIERIEGDYWNVVGLPISLVFGLFKKLESRV